MSNSGIAPTFEGLGFLPNGTSSDATGVSGDGSVAVGYATNSTGLTQAFSWSSGVMTSLGSLNPSTPVFSQAFGTNSDGSTVVGMSYYPANGAPAYALRLLDIPAAL
jgi:probable HAF family extracellular repeat protein